MWLIHPNTMSCYVFVHISTAFLGASPVSPGDSAAPRAWCCCHLYPPSDRHAQHQSGIPPSPGRAWFDMIAMRMRNARHGQWFAYCSSISWNIPSNQCIPANSKSTPIGFDRPKVTSQHGRLLSNLAMSGEAMRDLHVSEPKCQEEPNNSLSSLYEESAGKPFPIFSNQAPQLLHHTQTHTKKKIWTNKCTHVHTYSKTRSICCFTSNINI